MVKYMAFTVRPSAAANTPVGGCRFCVRASLAERIRVAAGLRDMVAEMRDVGNTHFAERNEAEVSILETAAEMIHR